MRGQLQDLVKRVNDDLEPDTGATYIVEAICELAHSVDRLQSELVKLGRSVQARKV